jgi:uncharacterized lipoprotein YajG
MKKIYFLIIIILAAGLLSACAEKGPILLTINYEAPEMKPETASKTVVDVSPLIDRRGKPSSVLGLRTIPDSLQNDLVVQDTVAALATDILKEAFQSRGITVKDAGEWNLTAEGIKTHGTGLLIGGEISALWIDSRASTFKTNLKSTVKLKIVAADRAEKKIIRTIDVNSSLEEDVLYSREKLEQTLSTALSAAIDQIFKDEELRKRLW